jgi:hypothetical protein
MYGNASVAFASLVQTYSVVYLREGEYADKPFIEVWAYM